MKKIAILFFCVVLSVVATAQNSLGVQAGVVSSSFSTKSENGVYTNSSKMKIGFKAGVYGEIQMSPDVFFQPGINYISKGGIYNGKSAVIPKTDGKAIPNAMPVLTNQTYSIKLNYVEVPLNLVYKPGDNPKKIMVGIGPVLSYGFGGKATVTTGGRAEEKVKVKFDGKNSTDSLLHGKPLELGANVFAGYELESGIRFMLQYRPNFTDNDATNNVTVKNSYFSFTVGVKL